MKDIIEILSRHKAVGFLVATLSITIMLFLTLFLYGKTMVAFKDSGIWGRDGYPDNTISIEGYGEVNAIPNIAEFSFTVSERSESSEEAQRLATTKINEVTESLIENGIEETDIKTISYNIYPNYSYINSRMCIEGNCPDVREPVITSYEVSQTTSVKIREVDMAGDFIALVGQQGVSNVSGLNFVVDDREVLEQEAAALAIADAKENAYKIAKELGVKLVRIVGYYESYDGGPMPYGGDSFMMKAEVASMSPNISTGESTVSKSVNITYEIK